MGQAELGLPGLRKILEAEMRRQRGLRRREIDWIAVASCRAADSASMANDQLFYEFC